MGGQSPERLFLVHGPVFEEHNHTKRMRSREVLLLLGMIFAQTCWADTEEPIRHPHFPNKKLRESERVAEYEKRNYTWPIEKFVPDTEGWKGLFRERIAQVEEIPGTVSRRRLWYLQ